MARRRIGQGNWRWAGLNHDAAELEAVLPPEPGAVAIDSAFAGTRPEGTPTPDISWSIV